MFLVGFVVLAGALTGVLIAGSGGDDARPSRSTVASTKQAEPVSARNANEAAAGADQASATTPAADPRDPAAWPLHGAAARTKRVPILMYHLIAAAPAGTAYPKLWVPPTELQEQVTALDRAGFTGVTLGEVWDAWHGEGRLPKRPVVLSFDDGDLSQVMGAAPILKAAGWPGVLNLATNHLGKGGLPMWGAKRLLKQGWAIDSHTVSHADVTTLDAAGFRRELAGSRAEIKAKFGVTPRFFCYPAGRNDPASRAAVKAAGYLAATTVDPGIAARSDDPFGLPRVRVDPGTSGSSLVALAKGQAAPPAGGYE